MKKRLEKIAATTASRITFGLVAEEYLANMADNDAAASTLSKNRWLLEDIASSLSSRPVKEITSAEVLDLLKRVKKAGDEKPRANFGVSFPACFGWPSSHCGPRMIQRLHYAVR